ncbi:MAG: hypothetical protein U0324_07590 [Polyangiales bacterium]
MPIALPTASLDGLPRAALLAMRDAGDALLACYRDLDARDAHLAGELIGDGAFEEERHYPPDEVRDPGSGAQYYFHAHLAGELGHFHTYARAAPVGEPAHLVGVSVDERGLPTRLFVTDLWATEGRWCAAADLPAMLARFTFDEASPFVASRALPALLALFRPEVGALFDARGEARRADPAPSAARVLAEVAVSIDARRAALDEALARGGP